MSTTLYGLFYDSDGGNREDWSVFYCPKEIYATKQERDDRVKRILRYDTSLEVHPFEIELGAPENGRLEMEIQDAIDDGELDYNEIANWIKEDGLNVGTGSTSSNITPIPVKKNSINDVLASMNNKGPQPTGGTATTEDGEEFEFSAEDANKVMDEGGHKIQSIQEVLAEIVKKQEEEQRRKEEEDPEGARAEKIEEMKKKPVFNFFEKTLRENEIRNDDTLSPTEKMEKLEELEKQMKAEYEAECEEFDKKEREAKVHELGVGHWFEITKLGARDILAVYRVDEDGKRTADVQIDLPDVVLESPEMSKNVFDVTDSRMTVARLKQEMSIHGFEYDDRDVWGEGPKPGERREELDEDEDDDQVDTQTTRLQEFRDITGAGKPGNPITDEDFDELIDMDDESIDEIAQAVPGVSAAKLKELRNDLAADKLLDAASVMFPELDTSVLRATFEKSKTMANPMMDHILKNGGKLDVTYNDGTTETFDLNKK